MSKADFTFFPAGENRTFDVDVAQNYHFRRPGRHVVRGCPTEGLARLAQEAVAGASHNFLGASEIDCEESVSWAERLRESLILILILQRGCKS